MTHVCVEFDDPADDLGREGGLLQVRQRLTCGMETNHTQYEPYGTL